MDKRDEFVEKAVNVLSDFNKKEGFHNISVETLKLIFNRYIQINRPPKKPGFVTSDLVQWEAKHGVVPPMYFCSMCKRYKPQSHMTVLKKDNGTCKDCHEPQKEPVKPDGNVIRFPCKKIIPKRGTL